MLSYLNATAVFVRNRNRSVKFTLILGLCMRFFLHKTDGIMGKIILVQNYLQTIKIKFMVTYALPPTEFR